MQTFSKEVNKIKTREVLEHVRHLRRGSKVASRDTENVSTNTNGKEKYKRNNREMEK